MARQSPDIVKPGELTNGGSVDPPVIPDHTLLRVIGRGAYGEVWLARNVMGAFRAVKVIWRRQFDSDRPYEREFAGIQRYEPVSRSTDGLVHVLHVGRDESAGYFYYVMELADRAQDKPAASATVADDLSGQEYSPRTLRSDLERLGRLASADCLRLAIDVSSGLAQLHRQGLVHRDVKPGNIIYVAGRAKLADLGLVSADGEGRTFVGTEGYIPPEGPGSPAADVYALGIALYEASTGFAPERYPDVPAEWLEDETANEALEFHDIILKACEGQRERRYQSAEAMQADLALLQSGHSVRHVRALERRYARWRFAGVVGTTLLVLALVAAFFANYRAKVAAESRAKETRLREQAQRSLAQAEAAQKESRQQLHVALLEQARAMVLSGELGQRVKALEAVRQAAAISNSAALRGIALAALALPDLRFERELPYGAEYTMRLCDPTFERIALCRDRGPVTIRATSDLRLLTQLPASTNLPAYLAEWSRDGRFLAVKRDYPGGGIRGDLEIWSVDESRRLLLLHNLSRDSVAFHPRLPRLLAAQTDALTLWDLERGVEMSRHPLEVAPRSLRFSADGEQFAVDVAPHRTSTVSIHQLATRAVVASNGFDHLVGSLAWHPSGSWLAVSDHGGNVHRLDARTGMKTLLGRHKAQATRVDFTPEGNYLFSGGWEREVLCWNTKTLQRSFNIWLNGYVGHFRADGRAYSLESWTALQLHAFERAEGHREFAEDLGVRVMKAAFSPDGRWLAAVGSDRLGVWDLQSEAPGALITNTGNSRVFFAPNGEVFTDRWGACFRWRILGATNEVSPPQLVPLQLRVPEALVSLCAASNGVVATGGRGSAVVDYDQLEVGPGGWKPTVPGLNGVSPDGRWLAVFQELTRYLFIYQLPELKRVALLTNATYIRAFQFSPAGDELAVSCWQGVEWWSTTNWQHLRAITNLNNQLYSPDGKTTWLSQQFRSGGLYDTRTLELLLALPIGTYPLAVSSDGRRIAVSVDLRRLQVWDLVEVRQKLRAFGLDWEK